MIVQHSWQHRSHTARSKHCSESLSIAMDHMNTCSSLIHSSRWTRNNDTIWQSSTVTLCCHATYWVTELVYGGYSTYRGWFVQFLHSFYVFYVSEKPCWICFYLWWKSGVLIVTKMEKKRDRKDIHTNKSPAGILMRHLFVRSLTGRQNKNVIWHSSFCQMETMSSCCRLPDCSISALRHKAGARET